MDHQRISVVIPVYNGARTISHTIECVLQQSLKPVDILVVDDGSTDDTAEILKRYGSKIVYIPKQNGGPASARNLGVQFAGGEYVAFTDSDCQPDVHWLRNLMKGFDDQEIGGVGGAVRSADGSITGEYVDLIKLLDPQEDRNGEIPYIITANACFRIEAVTKAGLFNEKFIKPGGEEAELCFRIRKFGYRFKSAKDAVVLHHHRQSAMSLLKTLANYGEGAYLIGNIWPDRRIARPHRLMLRSAISLRTLAIHFKFHLRKQSIHKAFYFTLLDYLRQPAFLWGYLRGQRRES